MKGAIQNPAAYLAAALRKGTERFDDCFPRGVTIGDLDGFVELGGHFLVLEFKLGDQEIPRGQAV